MTTANQTSRPILYLHGLGARPGGFKPRFLAEHGYDLVNPALPDDDFTAALTIAQQAYDENQPALILGSSRGGAVALNLESGDTPRLLIAPAWRRWGGASRTHRATIILHSPNDDLIPWEDSRALAEESGLPRGALVVVGRDHYITDDAALDALLAALAWMLG